MESEQPAILAYDTTESAIPPPRTRPKWVLAVVGVYALLLTGMLLIPWMLATFSADTADDRIQITLWAGGFVVAMVLAGLSLLIVPVRVVSRRPVSRSKIFWPLLGSGFLVAMLVVGGSLAVMEWMRLHEDNLIDIAGSAAAVWVGWLGVFALLSSSTDPASLAMRLHRKILAGSVLELLVAVPAHVVVRQRSDCCAGIYTGAGICLGVAVALTAFGPSVFLLYWRRVRQITP